MRALALPLGLFVLASLAAAAASTPAQGAGVEARWVVEPRNPELGEPSTWTLVLGRPRDVEVRAVNEDLELDDTWVLLAETRPVALPDPVDPDRVVVRRAWEVASLEPGLRELPAFEFEYVDEGVVRRIRVRGAELDVAGVLAQGEDAPRPLRGFRDVQDLPEPVSPWPGVLGLGALAAALLAAGWWRRRGRRPVEAPRADPLAWIAELERSPPESAEAVRAAHYELTRAVRARVDELRGAQRAARTDEEWLAAALDEIAAERREDVRGLFDAAARVKYAGERPTPFAVRETIQRGRTVLEALSAASPPAAPPAAQKGARSAREEATA